jgi:hypothetical protein
MNIHRPEFLCIPRPMSTGSGSLSFRSPLLPVSIGAPAPRPKYVQSAAGTVTLTQDVTRVLSHPELKHPIRARVYVHEQKTETLSRVAGMSDWIEFR